MSLLTAHGAVSQSVTSGKVFRGALSYAQPPPRVEKITFILLVWSEVT